jgi:phosphoglycolate phosphatase-like HAD superfamily hydrolase
MQTKVIILDFDGTVADTMTYLTDLAAGLLMERYNMTREEARRAYIDTTGLPFVQQMEILYPGDERNAETVRRFEDEKRRNMGRFDLFPDVRRAIGAMRRAGVKVCVSSGNYEDIIDDFMRARGLEVDLVMGFRPGFEKGRDHFMYAMRQLGSDPGSTVFVGDSIKDGERAQEAGIGFVAMTGLVSREKFRKKFMRIPIVSALEEVLHLLGLDQPARPDPGAAPRNRAEGRRPSE